MTAAFARPASSPFIRQPARWLRNWRACSTRCAGAIDLKERRPDAAPGEAQTPRAQRRRPGGHRWQAEPRNASENGRTRRGQALVAEGAVKTASDLDSAASSSYNPENREKPEYKRGGYDENR